MGNLIERTVLLTNKDSQGNTTMDFPITKIENVEGAEDLVKSVKVDLPVGHMYWSVEPNVPAGRLPALGATYNRALYADLWAWANSVGLVKSESEWQAIASANDGNCAYYSDGDGSTTFRVPSIKCWVKGASSVEEVGGFLQAGLPNIEGELSAGNEYGLIWEDDASVGEKGSATGAFKKTNTTDYAFTGDGYLGADVSFDASRCSSIYGNSDTVQPPSLVGQWLIVAFGIAHNIGEADVANVMSAVEQVQTGLGTLEQGVGTAIDYIVESYRNGTSWYEVYKSGKIRQGGLAANKTGSTRYVSFLKPFKDTKYTISAVLQSSYTWADCSYLYAKVDTTARFKFTVVAWNGSVDTDKATIHWVAEGQGA